MTASHGTPTVSTGPSGLAGRLWNSAVTPQDYATAGGEKYQAAVLEQYKLYVEMADRVSARRSLTNTFFLTINAALLAATGAVSRSVLGEVPAWSLALVTLVALCQCAVWFLLIRSYKQLNGAKYRVVGELEKRLPALLYSDAEWAELGEGKSFRDYAPLTHVELWVPVLFAALYIVAMGVVLIAR
ncbi:RipA family octameric membrane protein [Streptomyces werraensis]|uniref:RipA family octameric membrane protein n=1 Tax=Streptomyces werraensis TaxID=68284 RepID=UPI00342FF292